MNAICINTSCGKPISFSASPHDVSITAKCPHCGLEAEYFNTAKLLAEYNDSERTLVELESDAGRAFEEWRQDKKSQFWARTTIRCVCANIEARLFFIRRIAEHMATASGVQFDEKEMEILKEQREIVDKNGDRKLVPKWLRFEDSVKQSLRLYIKAAGLDSAIDYGAAGYTALSATFECRNHLMHPKNSDDIQITEANLDAANQGYSWLRQTITSMARPF